MPDPKQTRWSGPGAATNKAQGRQRRSAGRPLSMRLSLLVWVVMALLAWGLVAALLHAL